MLSSNYCLAVQFYQILALLNFLALLLVSQLPNMQSDLSAEENTESEMTVLLSSLALLAIISRLLSNLVTGTATFLNLGSGNVKTFNLGIYTLYVHSL